MVSEGILYSCPLFAADYIIEAQDIDQKGKFVEVGRVGPDDTEFKVTGLKNKGNYKFRWELGVG